MLYITYSVYFLQSSWTGQTKAKLKNAEIPQNVLTAETLLKEHKDLAEDIEAHQPV